jgi:hypothetical protein
VKAKAARCLMVARPFDLRRSKVNPKPEVELAAVLMMQQPNPQVQAVVESNTVR